MKQILIIAIILSSCSIYGQDCDRYTSAALSYVFPQGISAEAGMTFNKGFVHTANIGVSFQTPKQYTKKEGINPIDSLGNSLDIYSYVGWRLFRKDYVLSIYGNVGYLFGNIEGFRPLTSIKFLFPVNQISLSVEPIYIYKRGASARVSIHFKI